MSQLRIAFVVGSLCFGGAEKHTVALANGLPNLGFETHVLHASPQSHLRDDLSPDVRDRVRGLDKRGRLDPRVLWRLRRNLAEIQPNVIIAVNNYSLLLVDLVRWSLRRQPPLVAILHSTIQDDGWDDRTVRYWLRYTLERRCARAIFVSEVQRRHWLSHYKIGATSSEVIHNGVDATHFQPVMTTEQRAAYRARIGVGEDDRLVACCAALRPEKRQVDLVEAVRRLRHQGKQVRLVLIGEGSERSTIEAAIASAGLASYCQITGFQNDVRPWLEAADLVTLSSRTEGFPVSILEAMAMARPVVAPRVGGVVEQIAPGRTGELFEPGDVASLTSAIERVLTPAHAVDFGAAARQSIQVEFSESEMLRRYASVLWQVSPERRSSTLGERGSA